MRLSTIEVLIGVLSCWAAAAALIGAYYGYCRAVANRTAQLEKEWWAGHQPIRKRMRGLTRRHGQSLHVEPAEYGPGWVWIVVNAHSEAMGWAWTRPGARYRMATVLRGGEVTYLVSGERVDNIKRGRRAA